MSILLTSHTYWFRQKYASSFSQAVKNGTVSILHRYHVQSQLPKTNFSMVWQIICSVCRICGPYLSCTFHIEANFHSTYSWIICRECAKISLHHEMWTRITKNTMPSWQLLWVNCQKNSIRKVAASNLLLYSNLFLILYMNNYWSYRLPTYWDSGY